MSYIELVFFAFLFFCLGVIVGRQVIPANFRVAYAIACSIYALLLIFIIDVDLTFPIDESTVRGKNQLAPYWQVIVYLSGNFIMLGAIMSCSKNIFKDKV